MDDLGQTTTAEGGAWASLPPDLLVEIFRRVESKAVIRCATTCRPWRRAIIGNAFFIRPRPDRFLPGLLLGVFHGYGDYDHQHVYLRRTVPLGSLGTAVLRLPSTADGDGSESRIQSLIPATAGFDREMYTDLLSSRDGYVLLRGRRWWSGLCLLCNLITGDSKIIPDATIRSCTYVLLTGYDDRRNFTDPLAVRILAVAGTDKMMCTKGNRITYQVFSFASGSGDGGAGVWGPVRRSTTKLKTGLAVALCKHWTVVCGGTVYWLAGEKGLRHREYHITCAVGLDLRTGRVRTTWLQAETRFSHYDRGSFIFTHTLLATSGDGRRLSLIQSLLYSPTAHKIKVWVLTGDDQWSLQKAIDVQVQKLMPENQRNYFIYRRVFLNAFCPRSGCVIGSFDDHEICIDLEGSSHPCVESIGTCEDSAATNAYEMDWSTYISKMKQF